MRLTPEQKEAFRRADNATSIVKRSRGQWCIRHPWQDLEPEGVKTETITGFDYITARQTRARYTTFTALRLCGWDAHEADCVTDYGVTGRAVDIFRRALSGAI